MLAAFMLHDLIKTLGSSKIRKKKERKTFTLRGKNFCGKQVLPGKKFAKFQ